MFQRFLGFQMPESKSVHLSFFFPFRIFLAFLKHRDESCSSFTKSVVWLSSQDSSIGNNQMRRQGHMTTRLVGKPANAQILWDKEKVRVFIKQKTKLSCEPIEDERVILGPLLHPYSRSQGPLQQTPSPLAWVNLLAPNISSVQACEADGDILHVNTPSWRSGAPWEKANTFHHDCGPWVICACGLLLCYTISYIMHTSLPNLVTVPAVN